MFIIHLFSIWIMKANDRLSKSIFIMLQSAGVQPRTESITDQLVSSLNHALLGSSSIGK